MSDAQEQEQEQEQEQDIALSTEDDEHETEQEIDSIRFPANESPIITAEDIGFKPRTVARRVCARCPNKLAALNGADLCYACQAVAKRAALNGPVVVHKKRRPHADTI